MSKNKIVRVVVGVIGVIVGLVIIMMGNNLVNEYDSTHINPGVEFGAAYYSYQYDVTRMAVNEIAQLHNAVNDAVGMLIMVIGAACTAAFLALTMFAAFSDNKGMVRHDVVTAESIQKAQVLYSMPSTLYAVGSPVLVIGGTLSKDDESGNLFAQVEFRNLCNKSIKALTICLQPQDVRNNPIGEPVVYQYLDFVAKRGESFGDTVPVIFTELNARSFTVKVTEAVFADRSVWNETGAVWQTFTTPLSPERFFGDVELAKQFRLKCGENAVCVYGETADLWVCSCGEINHQDEICCYRCTKDRKQLSESMDRSALGNAKTLRLEKEAQEAQELETARKEANSVIKKITVVVVLAILAIVAVVYGSRQYTEYVYEDAMEKMSRGEYGAAAQAFEEMDYPGSDQTAMICRIFEDATVTKEETTVIMNGCRNGEFTLIPKEELTTVIQSMKYRLNKATSEWDGIQFLPDGSVKVNGVEDSAWGVVNGQVGFGKTLSMVYAAGKTCDVYEIAPGIYVACKMGQYNDAGSVLEYIFRS